MQELILKHHISAVKKLCCTVNEFFGIAHSKGVTKGRVAGSAVATAMIHRVPLSALKNYSYQYV